ncbi:hypothetical protein PHLGIDRAFT_121918 [Phlebiopsis gigantea 11061_1 CR5-6]|uniref:Uncharacterized protein n=1 Tax=Phlebiopsis gigantea (strain 11061_1 CR5-6) TaxID=745531 RepID=A0A0C3RS26_PHLG1|nr:hypothetical protein PHLGIDRAFT_121918 [Phlebiopsis gigantea 11061_1 CR5-6]
MSFEEDAFMELAFVAHARARSSYAPADTPTTRVLQRVVLCPSSDFSYNAIKALPWEQIDDVLGACHHLSSVDVLCGADMSADEAAVLAADLERRMPRTTTVSDS